MADAAGISRNHLQLLESGLGNRDGSPANPRLSTLQGLATVLGTDVPALVTAAFTDDHGTMSIDSRNAELFSE
nr:helix-turn-helix transcriptional regulator [Mycolicibacterium mageritense]